MPTHFSGSFMSYVLIAGDDREGKLKRAVCYKQTTKKEIHLNKRAVYYLCKHPLHSYGVNSILRVFMSHCD